MNLLTANKYIRLTYQTGGKLKIEGLESSSLYDGEITNGDTGTISFRNYIGVNSPYLEAELEDIKFIQSNDTIYLTHLNHPPAKLIRKGANEWSYEVINFERRHTSPSNIRVTSTNGSDETARYAISALSATTGEESLLGTSLDNEPIKTVTSFNLSNRRVTVANHGYRVNDYIAFMPNNRAYKITNVNGSNEFIIDFGSYTERTIASSCRKITSNQIIKKRNRHRQRA